MKLNGYRPTHRNKWLLLANKVLNIGELTLFDYYIDQMDFDKSHQLFGCFIFDLRQAAKVLGYESTNSIRTKHNKLLKLGFIFFTSKKNIFAIHNPDRYIAQTKKWLGKVNDFQKEEDNQPFEVIVKNYANYLQINERKIQLFEKNDTDLLRNNASRSLGSFKVKSNIPLLKQTSSSINTNNPTKEKWEKERLEDPGLPSFEDMLLINESVEEATFVKEFDD